MLRLGRLGSNAINDWDFVNERGKTHNREARREWALLYKASLEAGFEKIVKLEAACLGQRYFLAAAVEADGVANVINDDLTRVAVVEMGAEFIAHPGGEVAIDVFVELLEQVVTVHDPPLYPMRQKWRGLQAQSWPMD